MLPHDLPLRAADEVRRALEASSIAWGMDTQRLVTEIQPGHRLRSSLARTDVLKGIIRLHPDLLDGPADLLTEVVCHELAHLKAHRDTDGEATPHGPEWRALVRKVGYEPRSHLRIQDSPNKTAPVPTVRFRHTCPRCGFHRWANRPVVAWKCADCVDAGFDGALRVESFPAGVQQ